VPSATGRVFGSESGEDKAAAACSTVGTGAASACCLNHSKSTSASRSLSASIEIVAVYGSHRLVLIKAVNRDSDGVSLVCRRGLDAVRDQHFDFVFHFKCGHGRFLR